MKADDWVMTESEKKRASHYGIGCRFFFFFIRNLMLNAPVMKPSDVMVLRTMAHKKGMEYDDRWPIEKRKEECIYRMISGLSIYLRAMYTCIFNTSL